ncbi:lipase member H-A-like isoform X1 [Nomia melanderi]|uniref:lipase member H-A-like isoform X1 n=1 Tax=Nomia melanderi TaxID=2448451 RepID=UPI0013041AD4|nr:lipase member H-A-like isoform X1 [Nomia melanderi]
MLMCNLYQIDKIVYSINYSIGLYTIDEEQKSQYSRRVRANQIRYIFSSMENFHFLVFLGLMGFTLSQSLNGQPDVNTIFIRYYGNYSNSDINIQDTDTLMNYFKLSGCFVLYIHGYSESVNSESVNTIAAAYLNYTNTTLFAVDYSKFVQGDYLSALSAVDIVAGALASTINKLYNAGVDQLKCMHIVGHSLGGQVSGRTAERLRFLPNRITGLDPAGPLYFSNYLNASMAQFVDIIHTDAGAYGSIYDSGTVNFKPNFGHRVQPGCPLLVLPLSQGDYCSHHRSWRFWAETLKNETGFLAVKCNSDIDFILGLCDNKDIVPMGPATPRNTTGVYYLHTNANSPFAKGIEGINGTGLAENRASL